MQTIAYISRELLWPQRPLNLLGWPQGPQLAARAAQAAETAGAAETAEAARSAKAAKAVGSTKAAGAATIIGSKRFYHVYTFINIY